MRTSSEFIRQSLEIHLFFMRIMKEHSFFLQTGFTPRDANYTNAADLFRQEFDKLFAEVVSLSNGVISQEILQSGAVVTNYTLNAEMATSYLSGVQIPTQITQAEAELQSGSVPAAHAMLEQNVCALNQKAIALVDALIKFKANILDNVLSCKMFTVNYPLLIEHILREAKLYLTLIQRLQNGEEIDARREALEQEAFWNKIMAEHSKFIRGLLDPSEEALFSTADHFGNQFDRLAMEAQRAMNRSIPLSKVTEDSMRATKKLRDFKAQGTQGLLECKIKSIIIPLLGDHVLREANHFLHLLKHFSR